jgi:hypothetical protein
MSSQKFGYLVISCLSQISDSDSFEKFILGENMQCVPGGQIGSVPSFHSVLSNVMGFTL